jgi:hypothetical protein
MPQGGIWIAIIRRFQNGENLRLFECVLARDADL